MSHAPVRSPSCSVSLLCVDGDQNLGDDLVNGAQIRPTDPNDRPAGTFKIALPTLLSLDTVVDFIEGIPVFDASVELNGNFQVGQCNIDEVCVVIEVDFLLSGHAVDTCSQQCEQDKRLARRLTSSISAVNHPSGSLTSDGVEGSVGQGIVEFPACLLLTGARLILTETIEVACPGQGCAGDGKPMPVIQQAGTINNNTCRCRDAEAQVLDSWNRMAWPACADGSSGNVSSIRSYNTRKRDPSCSIKAVCVHEQILQAALGR